VALAARVEAQPGEGRMVTCSGYSGTWHRHTGNAEAKGEEIRGPASRALTLAIHRWFHRENGERCGELVSPGLAQRVTGQCSG
jgi:hypothetical protein